MNNLYTSPAEIGHSDDTAVMRYYVDTIKARHGVSQRDQAEALGVGWTTFRDWLNGTAKWPKSAQVVLDAWASSALPEDVDLVGDRCRGEVTLEEERRLVAAAKFLDDLDDTVRDWSRQELFDFARNDADHVTFVSAINGFLIDPETGDPLDFKLSEPAQKALHGHAYMVCQRAVLERLADQLEACDD
ncbi:TPA: hypothetical protein QEM49_004884 [Pseudomonas putida]|uniref:hypothetical protein n=1 Tax=Pseudomonas putida TaxID=303 RepID=UPI00236368E8|nr:hypothetical protein [Pseudomonas putida]MDD2012854.1 hypothetical protein [Pseudomonas putida]HDS1780303.1 hypothetical protein [Pseudomonas putida]